MLRSRANTLVSVRRVTEINAGRETAGVDGQVVLTARCQGRAGGLGAAPLEPVDRPARQAGVHPEGQRKAAPTRHSRDRGPRPPGRGPQRAGTRVGGTVRAEVLRIPAGPWLSRRDRRHLLHAERAEPAAGVGARRGPDGGVRPHRPSTTCCRARRVPRQGTDRAVAEGRSGRPGSVHSDRGGNSSRRGDQSRCCSTWPCTGWKRPPGSGTSRSGRDAGERGTGQPGAGEIRR